MKKKTFPDDFLWGASTSAYQVEGAAFEDGKKVPSRISSTKIPIRSMALPQRKWLPTSITTTRKMWQ